MTTPEAQAAQDETWWLIERPLGGSPRWFNPNIDGGWTDDANKAQRYGCRDVAEQAIANWHLGGDYRVFASEHVFVKQTTPVPAAAECELCGRGIEKPHIKPAPEAAKSAAETAEVEQEVEQEVERLKLGNGIGLIASERQRQIESEGWTADHDDTHCSGEMALAAACYAVSAASGGYDSCCNAAGDSLWPWDREWDKRHKHDRIRQLVIAGALIAAEIDRLKRAGESLMTEPNPATAAAEELQPCPFCAEHQLLQVHQETAGRWFVCCDCGKVVMKPLPLGTLPHFAAQAAEVAKLKAENTRLYDEVCEQIKKVAAMEDRAAAAEAARNNAVALLGESEQGQKILQLMGQLAVATRELEALRGALKLAIGRYAGVPWAAIDDEEVAAYCEEAAAIQSAKPETAE